MNACLEVKRNCSRLINGGICPTTTNEGIGARTADQGVVARPSGDHIVERIARAGEIRCSHIGQVFDIRRQGKGSQRSPHFVDALACTFRHDYASVSYDVGIIAITAMQSVATR